MNVPEQWLPSASDQEDGQRDRVRAVEAEWDQRQRRFGAREEREAVTGWLNSWASHLAAHPHRTDTELIWWIASQIEAGEHHKP